TRPRAALWATLGIWFASALPVYMYFLPFMSHAHSAFVASLFVWYWWRTYRNRLEDGGEDQVVRNFREWIVLGLLAALLFTTYYVNAVFWVFAAADFVALARRRNALRLPVIRPLLTRAAVPFAAGVAVGLAPHLVVKTILYGSPFALGYGVQWYPASPRLLELLFSSEHGLWTWTPMLFLASVGLVPLIRRQPAVGWRCTLTALLF